MIKIYSRIRSWAVSAHWVLSEQLGLDPLRFIRACRGIPLFLRDLIEFKKSYTGPLSLTPCFGDRFASAGAYHSEYFWQDLLVAKLIADLKPIRHVDIGSRLDGFVAHVAAFREIEVFDIRPIQIDIPGVIFKQADLMSGMQEISDGTYCDSVSCLHALEHFGLGRYGDNLQSDGYIVGLKNIARLLQPGGICYLSLPIGRQRVKFNANWVFKPETILNIASLNGLKFDSLKVITASGPQPDINDQEIVKNYDSSEDRLGLFCFIKIANNL